MIPDRDRIAERLIAVGYVADRDLATALWLMDYFMPTAVETPKWETDWTTTPSPHHPIGAKGVGESATVGAPAAIANAVVDALWHLGVRHIDIPITPWKVWEVLNEKGVAE